MTASPAPGGRVVERTVEFAPVASPMGLPPGGIVMAKPSLEMEEVIAKLRERWQKAMTQTHRPASALAFHDAPAPLLPGWGWPMAEPDGPTPIYDELCTTMPDPTGTPVGSGREAEKIKRDGAALLNDLDRQDENKEPGDDT